MNMQLDAKLIIYTYNLQNWLSGILDFDDFMPVILYRSWEFGLKGIIQHSRSGKMAKTSIAPREQKILFPRLLLLHYRPLPGDDGRKP